MTKFMNLFRGSHTMANMSLEQMEVQMGRWKSWMGGLAQSGTLVDVLPLNKEGKTVSNHGKTTTDGLVT